MSQSEWSFRDVNNQELDSTCGYSFASSSHPSVGSSPEKGVMGLFSVIPRPSVLYPPPHKPTGWFLTFLGTGQGWEERQVPSEQAELGTDFLLAPWWTLWCFHLSAAFHFPWRDALVVWMLASQLFQVSRSPTFTSSFFQPTEQNPSQRSMPQPHSCSSGQCSFFLLLPLSSMGPLCSPNAGNRSQSITLSNAKEIYPFWKWQQRDPKGRDHEA